MKKRVADLITRFRAEGLEIVQRGLQTTASGATKLGQAIARVLPAPLVRIGAAGVDAGKKITTGASNGVNALTRIGAQGANAAVRGLTRAGAAGGRMGSQIARGASQAARAVAQIGTRAGAAAAVLGALGKVAIGSAISASVRDTVEDVSSVRRMSDILGMSPERASFWTDMGGDSGIQRDEMLAMFGAYQTAVTEAATDAESEFAKTFKSIGLHVKDASGRVRDMSFLMGDLALATSRMNASARGQLLSKIFGEGDAAKISELMRTVGAMGVDGANAEFRRLQDANELVTPEQIQQVKTYQAAANGLSRTIAAIKRLIFSGIAPGLTNVLTTVSELLSENKQKVIDYFVRQFENFLYLIRDVVAVFSGGKIDLTEKLGMTENKPPQWLFDVRDVLKAIGELVAPLMSFFARLATQSAATIRGIDPSVIADRMIEGIQDFQRWIPAFGRDLQAAFSRLTVDPIDYKPREMETQLGGTIMRMINAGRAMVRDLMKSVQTALDNAMNAVRDTVTTVITYVQNAWAQAMAGFSAGVDVSSMESGLAAVILALRYSVQAVQEFIDAFRAVFVLGEEAPDGFKWLEDIRDTLGTLMSTLGDLSRLIQPVFRFFDNAIRLVTAGLVETKSAALLLAAAIGLKIVAALNLLTAGLFGKTIGLLTSLVIKGVGAIAGASGLTAAIAGIGAASQASFALAVTAATGFFAAVATGMAGLGIGAAIGKFAYDGLIKDWQDKRNDQRTGRFVDSTVRPMMDASLDRHGVKAGALDAYNARQGRFDLSGVSAVDVSAANVNLESSQRPVVVNFNGKEAARLSGTSDEIARMQRSAAASLGG